MKPTTLLLAASLIGNIALAALLAIRGGTQPGATGGITFAQPKTDPNAAQNADALRAALASGDAAALAAAGVSPEIARDLMIGRTFSRMAEKIQASRSKSTADEQWWRGRSGFPAAGGREQQLIARRELSDALIAAFGDDLGLAGTDQSQYAFLPGPKRDALRRIIQDYDEMMAKFGAGGVQLASDREKLKLLRAERDRDIAALLTPEERVAYEMRSSISGNMVRSRYGDAIESEAEFQKIYALQKAFDEKFPRDALTGRIPPEVLRARADGERELEAGIRAAVGEDRYAALRRAADPDVRTIDSLASRLNLPSSTTDSVLASRDAYAAASQKISGDAALSMAERRQQIQALASQAKSELARTLGGEAAEAYAQRSPWLNLLQGGTAYSTTPPDNAPRSFFPGPSPSIYPVMPAGSGPGVTSRQVVVNATPNVDGVVTGDSFTAVGDMRVLTFPAGPTMDPANPAAGAVIRQGIVTPTPANPAPPPSNTSPANPTPRR